MRERRARRALWAMALFGAGALPGLAAAQDVPQVATTLLFRAVTPEGEERIVAPGGAVAVFRGQSIRAVRLSETATPARRGDSAVAAGTVLFGTLEGTTWRYCAPRVANRWQACFTDSDRDGRFDQVEGAVGTPDNIPMVVTSHRDRQDLAAPAAYVVVPASEGPALEGWISWDPVGGSRTRPATSIVLNSMIGDTHTARGVRLSGPFNRPVMVRIGDMPRTVEAWGTRFRFEGMTPEGAVRVRIEDTPADRLSRFAIPGFIPPGEVAIHVAN